jgi:DNA invertase Pin-like site-specific DNA recombinase
MQGAYAMPVTTEAEGQAFSDNTADTKLVAYSYRRWSTPAQNDGTSLARQTAFAARWCSEHGYHLDTDLNLTDAGVSAYRGRNATEGALAAFLDACRSGRVAKGSVLLLENLDRLSRDVVRKAARTLEDICAEGIDVVDLSDGGRRYSLESLDSDPMQFIVMTMHFMRANQESVMKGQRVRAAREHAHREARTNGRLFTAMLPQWLEPPSGPRNSRRAADITVIEDRAAVVRDIFTAFVAGEGQHSIARRLDASGIRAWGPSGRWTRRYIQKILRTPAVLGTYIPCQTEVIGGTRRCKPEAPIENYYPRIIDDKLWHEAQARLAEVHPRGKAATKPVRNVLQGLCRCSVCGGTMSKVRSKWLVCGEANSRQKHKQMPVVYRAVVEALLKRLPAITAKVPRGTDAAELQEKIDRTRVNLDVAEIEQQDIVDEIVTASAAERPALRKKLVAVTTEANAFSEALANLLARAQATEVTDVAKRLDALTEALKARQAILGGDDAATEAANRALKRALTSIDFDAKGFMTLRWRHLPEVEGGDIRFSSRWLFRDASPLPPGGYTVPTQRRQRRGRKTVDSSSAGE